jgi:transposase
LKQALKKKPHEAHRGFFCREKRERRKYSKSKGSPDEAKRNPVLFTNNTKILIHHRRTEKTFLKYKSKAKIHAPTEKFLCDLRASVVNRCLFF